VTKQGAAAYSVNLAALAVSSVDGAVRSFGSIIANAAFADASCVAPRQSGWPMSIRRSAPQVRHPHDAGVKDAVDLVRKAIVICDGTTCRVQSGRCGR